MGSLPAVNPFATLKAPRDDFFRLIPQVGITHLLTDSPGHNAIWDMAVSPEGRVFFAACGETGEPVYARLYECDIAGRRLIRHFDLEKRLSLDPIGLRTSKLHTAMAFIGDHRMLMTTHTTSPSPRHPTWMPYEYANHPFEGFKGSDLLIYDYETGETRGLGKFTSHDTTYGATYDPKTGDYFAIGWMRGRGYVYNVRTGERRELGQVSDSHTSRAYLCSDGHIYGSTFSGAIFRYNTDLRDIEFMGVSAGALLRHACEVDGVLYFLTGTCGLPDRGQELFAYDLRTRALSVVGPLVPEAETDLTANKPQFEAYGMAFDGQGRMWYCVQTITPNIMFAGSHLYVWDFLHGGKPVDCGFVGTPTRTVSLVAEMRIVGETLVISDGNHTSDRDMPCGVILIDLKRFVPALADPSAPRPFSHDYVSYLPYPAECWHLYPKDDFADCYARYAEYDERTVRRLAAFGVENAFRLPQAGACAFSVWERVGRGNSAVRAIRWTSSDTLSFWCGKERIFRADCRIGEGGTVLSVVPVTDAELPQEGAVRADCTGVRLPYVPGRQYLAVPEASVRLADGGTLVGTRDGMLAAVDGDRVRSEGGVMTGGGVHALDLAPDGTVWGVSGHDQGIGHVFTWTRTGGLRLLGMPPEVRAANGRNVALYEPTTVAVSPDGRHVAIGGDDEIGGVVVLPTEGI